MDSKFADDKITSPRIKQFTSANSRVISVCSGKGGVGKTFFTVNLGLALAKLGKKVLLFDGDLGLGNLNVVIGFIPKFTIYHVIKGHRSLRDIILHTADGIDVIPGASGFMQIADLDEKQREELLRGFSQIDNYDYILIDGGAGINMNVVSFALSSDEVILVVNPEPTSITDGYGFIKSVITNDNSKKIYMVINKIRDKSEGERVIRRMTEISEKFLSYKPEAIGMIPFDIEVENSIKKQKPILLSSPNSKTSENIITIARKILGLESTHRKKPEGILNFFKKRFGLVKPLE